VSVLARGPALPARIVLLLDRVDPAAPNAVLHQGHQIGPQRVPLLAGQRRSGQLRVEAMPEQGLRPVDVADPGHDRLVHEQRGQRCPRP
jgi:hypothetical protein